MKAIVIMMAIASPLAAETVSCRMAAPCPDAGPCSDAVTDVKFHLDRRQFIDAVSPEEPIRRKVTIVQFGETTFPAEPFIIGQTRGFHAEGLGGTNVMFVARADRSALFTNIETGLRLVGTCEE